MTDSVYCGPEIITFGCRLNAYESEIIARHAKAAKLDDTVVINTCAVTGEAVRQARQAIRRARRRRPQARIVVTGCAAQIDPGEFAKMDAVDQVIGNEEKLRGEVFHALAADDGPTIRVNDIMSVTETAGHLVDGFGERARAFVQIQTGCDHRCTFCIIPYSRGNSRSVPMGEVVRQIRTLVAAGYHEVVLTGVDLTSYGGDLPGHPRLGDLVQKILNLVPSLDRLRLSSIDSMEVDDALMEAIAGEDRLMPHLHLSLQAGDNLVLKRMKRRHLREDAIRFCDEVRHRRPDMTFGADLIAGFPTETEEMFDNTLSLVDACGLTFLHVFPYSSRSGTPAARMPQVPKAVRKERAARLRAAGAQRLRRKLDQMIGRHSQVLIEKTGPDGARGYSEEFLPVVLPGRIDATGILAVRITGRQNGKAIAEPVGVAA